METTAEATEREQGAEPEDDTIKTTPGAKGEGLHLRRYPHRAMFICTGAFGQR